MVQYLSCQLGICLKNNSWQIPKLELSAASANHFVTCALFPSSAEQHEHTQILTRIVAISQRPQVSEISLQAGAA